jgi:glycosyltransferase involved in cell wall biosynthesis
MKPSVSVIITTYNRREFVKEAIESVLKQDFLDYEIIVVDDGSTDGTKEVLQKYNNVHFFYQENQGVSRARNQGLKLAQGEFISFLDSDDLWLPNKLFVQITVMGKNPEISITYTDEIWVRRGKRVNPRQKHQKYSGWIFERCLPLCIISPSSVMLRQQVFEEVGAFDEDLPVCEDYDLWLRISARFPILFINEKLIVKQGGHKDQLSHRFWGNDRFRVKALEKIISDDILDGRQKQLVIQELIKKSIILENGFKKRGKMEESNYYQSLIERYKSWLPQ